MQSLWRTAEQYPTKSEHECALQAVATGPVASYPIEMCPDAHQKARSRILIIAKVWKPCIRSRIPKWMNKFRWSLTMTFSSKNKPRLQATA